MEQEKNGKADQGLRSAGVPLECVFRNKALELPGYFRPTKEWDLLVVREKKLIVAIEAKSQVGPSCGNNFNNRTEEAMGSALDLWTAFRERAYLDVHNLFWDTSSCWKTVTHQIVR